MRSGLRLLLESEKDIEVVGEAGDVREAVLEARSTHPDVVLMDVVMPDMSGIEGIAQGADRGAGDEGALSLHAGRPSLCA